MRLREHRKNLKGDGYRGPLLRFDELTAEERNVVHGDFMERMRRDGADGLWEMWCIYVETLHLWGVICPHPIPFRLYEGFHETDSPVSFEDSQWFHCRLCQSAVINR